MVHLHPWCVLSPSVPLMWFTLRCVVTKRASGVAHYPLCCDALHNAPLVITTAQKSPTLATDRRTNMRAPADVLVRCIAYIACADVQCCTLLDILHTHTRAHAHTLSCATLHVASTAFFIPGYTCVSHLSPSPRVSSQVRNSSLVHMWPSFQFATWLVERECSVLTQV
jgi:hypothetical protein